ncbi:serine/threonine-protein kinase [Streptomyces sp. E11-3]|uniref:serine/threonine-protein kinase n=1 Tax=Streptomyces sp. E11-3 TaxID=3110112 RepID=UPI00397F282C
MAQEWEPGRVVGGRYELAERLGAGGFGQVWRARDEVLRIDVAVKFVRIPPSVSDEEQQQRLSRAEREARNAARLRDHPNVVAVHDVLVDDGVPCIVMQLVEGVSLQQRLDADGPLNAAATAVVGSALLGALGSAHAAGIQHRDVKPGNVMLTRDDRVLLTDFGIAVHHQDTALTQAGMIIGSVEYVAPERARGESGGPAADLFSLGVTLYQAVEGVSPFRRDTASGTLSAVLFDDPPAPRRAGGPLTEVFARLLVKDPGRRATVEEAAVLLRAIAAGDSGHVPVLTQPRSPGSDSGEIPDRRRRRAVGALAVAERAARAVEGEDHILFLARVAGVWACLDGARALRLTNEIERILRALDPGSDDREDELDDETAAALVIGYAELAGALSALAPGRSRELLGHAEEHLRAIGEDREALLLFLARAALAVDPPRGRQFADELEGIFRAECDDEGYAEALEFIAAEWVEVDPGRAGELRAEARARRLVAEGTESGPERPDRSEEDDVRAWLDGRVPGGVPAPDSANRGGAQDRDRGPGQGGVLAPPGPVATARADEAERAARALPRGRGRTVALLQAAQEAVGNDPERGERLFAEAQDEAEGITFVWRRESARRQIRDRRIDVARTWAVTYPERAVTQVELAIGALGEDFVAAIEARGGSLQDGTVLCGIAETLAGAAAGLAGDPGRALDVLARSVSLARRMASKMWIRPALRTAGQTLVQVLRGTETWSGREEELLGIAEQVLDDLCDAWSRSGAPQNGVAVHQEAAEVVLATTCRLLVSEAPAFAVHAASARRLVAGLSAKWGEGEQRDAAASARSRLLRLLITFVGQLLPRDPGHGLAAAELARQLTEGGDPDRNREASLMKLLIAEGEWHRAVGDEATARLLFDGADRWAVLLGDSDHLVTLVEARAATDPGAAETLAREIDGDPGFRARAWLAVARGWVHVE